jgi:ABC-2 type transport system ATP-binding protein
MNDAPRKPSEFSSGAVLRTANVAKTYGRQRVLTDVCFEVGAGEVVGIVGPNGAGKTTLLMALSGFLEIDAGTIEILGRNVVCGTSPPETVLIPDNPPFYGFLSAWQHLRMWSELAGKHCRPEVLRDHLLRVGLPAGAQKKKVSQFSRGMRQRLAWAHAMMYGPKLLLLDEPTAGLDPEGTILARDLVTEFSQLGTAVLFSSHSMNEISRVCHRVFFLNHGELSLLPQHKQATCSAKFEVQIEQSTPKRLQLIREHVHDLKSDGNYLQLSFAKPMSVGECVSLLSGLGIQVTSIADLGASLEERFLEKLEEVHIP